MGASTDKTTRRFRVLFSRDRIQVFIESHGVGDPGYTPLDEDEVLGTLMDVSVPIDDVVRKRVGEYITLTRSGSSNEGGDGPPEIPERFVLAEGKAPVEAVDGEFVWDAAYEQEINDWSKDAPVDYYTRNSILTIDVGQVVGVIKPPRDGASGRDVLGNEVKPRRRKGTPLSVGNGLSLADDGSNQVVTTVAGRLVRDGSTVSMNELLKIPRDVDFKSGNVDCVAEVHVCGMVKPNFSVRTTKSLTIEKGAESAELIVGKDLVVRRGVFGQESNRLIKVGGNISAAICDAARIEAGGDVKIAKEIINSSVRVNGRLEIERGAIIGGEIHARNGVKAKNIGSNAGVPTRVAVGIDAAVLFRARKMEKDVAKLTQQSEQIRTQVQPLLANIKRLTSTQREQATELMCKADEIGGAADEMADERKTMIQNGRSDESPGVDVTGALHVGVVLAFGLRETTVKTALTGPLRVEERQVKGVTEIVLVNPNTGSVTVLPSMEVDPSRFAKPDDGESGEEHGTD